MNGEHAAFQYRSAPKVPKAVRQLDETFVNAREMSFSEGEQTFDQLREDCRDSFADAPFAYVHFLRGIESRLLSLSVEKKQPISKCLEYLRRRLDLEYSRGDIYGKAAQAVILARYAAECGEVELGRSLLKQEREQLCQLAETCQSWQESITQCLEEMAP